VNFKNTIIIMTSNIGSHIIRERFAHLTEGNRTKVVEDLRSELFELLKQTIRPEFLNRIDEIIMFTPLSRKEIHDIVRLQFALVAERLKKSGYETTITDAAVDWIAEAGFDPQFGARPVKRMMQKYLLNDLSKDILAGKVSADHPVAIDVKDDKLVFVSE
jgi:ATP-dependent Clp protease ATP-binding subunit ClpB